MKTARTLIAGAVAITGLLAGTSTALAATSPAASHAALAATSPAASPAASLKYLYWSSYPTLQACNAEGDHLYLEEHILYWKCPEYSEGSYFIYKLYVVLGHPPGS